MKNESSVDLLTADLHRQVVLKAVGTALGLLGAAAVGGLAAVFSNMR